MKIWRIVTVLAGPLLFGHPAWAQQPDYQTGMIPAPHISLPAGKDLAAMVFLISNGQGWGEREEAQAKALVEAGAAVVGVDFPSYMRALAEDQGDCVYMISDVEDISQQVQRRVGNPVYRHPIVAGIGEGGALALAMISQSPLVTIGQAVAVDPAAGIPLAKELCTPASKENLGARTIYGFQDGPLPAEVTVALTQGADPAGVAHAQKLKQEHPDVQIQQIPGTADAAFMNLLTEQISRGRKSDQPLELPLTVLEAAPVMNTMAVVFSGDGGWRDIDSEVGGYLQKQGIPTVGIDSLRYFWSERQPQEVANDLSRIMSTYRRQWGVSNVILIGYSFGADVLPAAYNLLPEADKRRIRQISLLALSKEVDYEISVTGWLGVAGDGKGGDTVAEIAKIDPHLVQCVYGTDEDDDPCPDLKARGVETVPIEGGHHFDEDYEALGKRIVESLLTRLKK
ncbi:virulence factor family protein [Rhizobium deserti]|uniref:Virulence factor family protein n=1 Tax=Rhizobium deserti TaxID=2547961 RepID=A0A4R5UG47_9HYPH|nr:AcvB/VirJ family lysyl-phosphatidylglycerol hydrolase [Rhizobium deserti]TDK34364.1 virulence factor family protein [Rhizobium deserti]